MIIDQLQANSLKIYTLFTSIINKHTSPNTIIHPIKIPEMQQNPYHSAHSHIKKSFSIQAFEKFVLNSKDSFPQLSKMIKDCNVDDIHCRFNTWRLCLGVIGVNSDLEQKRKQLSQSRLKYSQKKQQALKSYNKKSPIKQPVKKNPLLMMGPIKPQDNKQIETDQFLKQEIHKDVERTYQEMNFFQDKAIAKLLNLLLFVWCRRNPDVSYKQGMNELLASVVVCYFKEAEFKVKGDKPEDVSDELWDNHLFFNSIEYVESDIFSVFQKIIDIQGNMYKTDADITLKSKISPISKNNTPILQRIIQIKDHKLKHMDLELFRILKLQDVQTKSFMLRWIRCMHTREFDLDNSFVIWDSIFLEFLESQNSKKNKQFQFIDAMCLAMFMYMRSIIFTKETAGEILQVYQKYPPLKRGAYLDQLITLAWTICEELRVKSQNNQAPQSNWFQESSEKIKALHFMEKKTEKKTEQQTKPTQSTKKHEPHPQKQLKQTDHSKKNPQLTKKHTQPLHQNQNHKSKDVQSHHSEGTSNSHPIHPQIIKPKQQKTNSDEKINQNSVEKKKEENSLLHKSSPNIEKQAIKVPVKTTNSEEIVKEVKIDQKEAKQEKERQQKLIRQKQQSLPSPFHNKQPSGPKVPQNLTITLTSAQIAQMLENLHESLPKIRDIDAQSLIRRTIKKLQGKLKQ